MPIRVLVADDSAFMRKLITGFISADPDLSVAGIAKNGREAVQLARELSPDVITMDVEMPELNGLNALKQIMSEQPIPVLMLSSLTQFGAQETMDALRIGAVDFIPKPSGSISLDLHKVEDELRMKIKQAVKARVNRSIIQRRPVELSHPSTSSAASFPEKAACTRSFDQIIAIGTSTGGPRALDAVIPSLPAGFPYPILVVQHMPPKFTASLAQRLNQFSRVRVVEAEDGQQVAGGTVYIAPGDFHMVAIEVAGMVKIRLHQNPVRNGHRPSVGEMFESVSRLKRLKRHFVIMTGMGDDGAREMVKAKQEGASSTIAESKESCVVFGMPKAAIELGGVDYIIPLEQIANQILRVTQ